MTKQKNKERKSEEKKGVRVEALATYLAIFDSAYGIAGGFSK